LRITLTDLRITLTDLRITLTDLRITLTDLRIALTELGKRHDFQGRLLKFQRQSLLTSHPTDPVILRQFCRNVCPALNVQRPGKYPPSTAASAPFLGTHVIPKSTRLPTSI
jgi:hypothetical protein